MNTTILKLWRKRSHDKRTGSWFANIVTISPKRKRR
jgi:hypothetical protein